MEAKKSYIGIRNAVDNSTIELYFTDYIFDSIDWDVYEMTNMVQDTIDKIKAANPTTIKLTINSLGGDVMIGLAIYNFLKNYKAEVEVDVIGFAASIASIMAMSASKGKLRMASNSFMILHSASSMAAGNAKDMRTQAAVLDKVSGEMAEIYAQRTGKEASYFIDMWADGDDHWFTGKEAKALGLADELTNAAPITASVNLESYGYKNIPTKIFSLIQSQKNTMAFPKTLTTAKAEAFQVVEGGFLLEEDQLNNIEAQITGAETIATALVTVEADRDTVKASLVTANTEIDTLKAAAIAAATASTEAATASAARIAALEAEVAKLGKAPSGTGTTLSTEKDESVEKPDVPAFLADDSAINAWYDQQTRYQKKMEAVA